MSDRKDEILASQFPFVSKLGTNKYLSAQKFLPLDFAHPLITPFIDLISSPLNSSELTYLLRTKNGMPLIVRLLDLGRLGHVGRGG